ncbi:hypothetical protein [Brevibacterium luteolum]|uniref:Aminoglycoside phosphotransferase domain-containing protein n=1 Tax=Brevibacterium luteolum TaxID=199591 RepID=A0A6G8KZH1_9MICO|nr:hypothetical protein [Brevibacterium luteolum]QIN30179.1 hypothetical protein EW640_13580 [Brevibacterium luteolum]
MSTWYENIDEWASGFGHSQIEWKAQVPQVPSPSWWASDSVLYRGQSADHGTVLLKRLTRHAWSWRNRDNLMAAATTAGEIGVGPRVLAADPELGLLLMEDLGPRWKVGRLDVFQDQAIRQSIRAAREAFADSGQVLSQRSPLIELNHLVDECRDYGVSLDKRIIHLLELVNEFKAPLLEYRSHRKFYPSQGEGTVSNFMIGPGGQVKLVGWSSAAMLSKVHDSATLVAEACPGALDLDDYVRELLPDADATDRAVLKLVTGIEHLRWAVLTHLRAVLDPDVNLDSIKYGLWRMTLAELLFNEDATRSELKGELL